MMNELEAWQYLVDNLVQEEIGFSIKHKIYYGLCPVLKDLYRKSLINLNTYENMQSKIPEQTIKINNENYAWEPKKLEPRLEFCKQMVKFLQQTFNGWQYCGPGELVNIYYSKHKSPLVVYKIEEDYYSAKLSKDGIYTNDYGEKQKFFTNLKTTNYRLFINRNGKFCLEKSDNANKDEWLLTHSSTGLHITKHAINPPIIIDSCELTSLSKDNGYDKELLGVEKNQILKNKINLYYSVFNTERCHILSSSGFDETGKKMLDNIPQTVKFEVTECGSLKIVTNDNYDFSITV